MPQTTYTAEQVKAWGEETRQLVTKAEVQLAESKQFLRREILRDGNITAGRRNQLLQSIGELSLTYARVDDKTFGNKLNAQVCWSFPDDLHDYLRQEPSRLPESLRGFMRGGITVESKDTAIDPSPQTGKTKAGTRGA